MNQTTNYNFNVPVGSDVVNSLVQDFPNWSSLDTILRNIANTGITTATHIKSGTIHTLSFSDTTVPMIRFQATADFNTNDTFTVNGLSVSALTVAGESLPAGAFVIGSMVLCELRDNLLTVYSSGSDASTLEGHPASYFATNSDLQTVDDKADANKVLIDQINNDLSARKTLYLQSAPTVQQLKDARSVTIICRGQTASPNLPLRLYPELIVSICGYTWDGSQRWFASALYIWSKVNGTITLNSHEEQIANYGLDVIAGWILDF